MEGRSYETGRWHGCHPPSGRQARYSGQSADEAGCGGPWRPEADRGPLRSRPMWQDCFAERRPLLTARRGVTRPSSGCSLGERSHSREQSLPTFARAQRVQATRQCSAVWHRVAVGRRASSTVDRMLGRRGRDGPLRMAASGTVRRWPHVKKRGSTMGCRHFLAASGLDRALRNAL